MKWFADVDTDWRHWDFGVGFSWNPDEFCAVKVMLGPWSLMAGKDRPMPPFDPGEWASVTIPVEP